MVCELNLIEILATLFYVFETSIYNYTKIKLGHLFLLDPLILKFVMNISYNIWYNVRYKQVI
jgi:hypothetical protein